MKLYATITSERATKGQGGKQLDIEISGQEGLPLICIDVRVLKDRGISATMFLMGDSRTSKMLEAYPPEDKYNSCADGGWIETKTNQQLTGNDFFNIGAEEAERRKKVKRQKGDIVKVKTERTHTHGKDWHD